MEFQHEGERFTFVLERKRVRRINARMRDDGTIRVSAPPHVPEADIVRFLTEHGAAFARIRRNLEARRATLPTYADGSVLWYLGAPVTLRHASHPQPTRLENGTLTVFARTPEEAQHAVSLWLRGECAALFREYNRSTCEAFRAAGFAVPLARIEVKEMTSRWGSCTAAKGRISMNLRLMHYPPECIRCVFCHEYAHFLRQDHSPAFYAVLQRVCPDYARWDAVLRERGMG